MKKNEFCVSLIKSITEALLDYMQNPSEVLKVIKLGVEAALNSRKKR